MQVKIMRFFRQLAVLVQRCLVLIWNDKLTAVSLLLQAPVMVGIFYLVGDRECFTSNLVNIGSRTMLFILCAMSAFMGILNAYREICKEREIVFREASVGVSLVATVLSKAAVLLVVELVQAVILTVGFCAVIQVPQLHLIFDTNLEIYITVVLMLFASSAMGLLISAALKSSESAILPVLMLIIAQVVFSGCLFPLSGALGTISSVVVCRWGIGALGASTDLNSRLAWLNAGLDGPMYDATVENLMHSWQMLALIALACIAASCLVLQNSFNKRKG